jgi:hypothetical protein
MNTDPATSARLIIIEGSGAWTTVAWHEWIPAERVEEFQAKRTDCSETRIEREICAQDIGVRLSRTRHC